jgi:DNA helicase II / ATP-dependent DNA helicase PcrA
LRSRPRHGLVWRFIGERQGGHRVAKSPPPLPSWPSQTVQAPASLEARTGTTCLQVTDGAFTPPQLQAITAGEGPLAVVAGPGCGKTTVLAARVAYLLNERGFDPSTILVVTFTTEAARRLRREAARELGDRAADVSILTLHALGRRVIDTWAIQLGYDDRPSVLHQDEARAPLASAAGTLGWDLATLPVH